MAAAISKKELTGLPVRLLNFFQRYPPEVYSARITGVTLPLTRKEAKEAAIAKNLAKQQTEEAALETAPIQAPPTMDTPSMSIEAPIPIQSAPSDIAESSPTIAEASTNLATEQSTFPSLTTESSDVVPEEAVLFDHPVPAKEEAMPPAQLAITPSSHVTTSQPTAFNGRLLDGLTRATRFPSNPFLPFKNPLTGRWAGARISLRCQADLCKIARKHNVEDLLPPSRKSQAFKDARIIQRGLRVKGTGEGQKVKGHKWERMMPVALKERKEALEGMPALIRAWEARGHGRGWRKWPRAKTR